MTYKPIHIEQSEIVIQIRQFAKRRETFKQLMIALSFLSDSNSGACTHVSIWDSGK